MTAEIHVTTFTSTVLSTSLRCKLFLSIRLDPLSLVSALISGLTTQLMPLRSYQCSRFWNKCRDMLVAQEPKWEAFISTESNQVTKRYCQDNSKLGCQLSWLDEEPQDPVCQDFSLFCGSELNRTMPNYSWPPSK